MDRTACARLDDGATPARTDELYTSILDGEVAWDIGEDALQECMGRLLCVVANIVVRTDLGSGGHKLDIEAVPVCRDARFVSLIGGIVTLRFGAVCFRVKEERLRCLCELVDRGLGSVREVGFGIAFQFAVAGRLAV